MVDEIYLFSEKSIGRSFFKKLENDMDEAYIAQTVTAVLGDYCNGTHGFDSLPVFGTNEFVCMPIKSNSNDITLVVNSQEVIAQKALAEIVYQCSVNNIGLRLRYLLNEDNYDEQMIC